MVKLFVKNLIIPIALILSISLVSASYAQDNQAVQGNIIHQISVTSDAGVAVLQIKGAFNPEQLANAITVKKGEGLKFTVSIPNALIDPEKITEPFMEFSAQTPLKSVQILENIKENEDDVVFTVDLVFEGRKDVTPALTTPITPSLLTFRLQDPSSMRQQVAQSDDQQIDEKKKEMDDDTRRTASEERKQADASKQKKDEMTRQSASDIIKHYRRPSLMQISIINASGWAKRAYQLSVFLGKLKKKYIEENLGIKLNIVNISTAKDALQPQSTIYYKENYLKSALFLANIIEGEQRLVPMDPDKERLGVDVEIFLGKDFK